MNKLMYVLFLLIVIGFFTLTMRGNIGNPTAYEIEYYQSNSGHAFETSQERSRYAIILSLVNDHSFAIDNYASMGTPDIGYIQGHFYSFFPPGGSILAIPFYLIGEKLGIAQLAVFSISTVFSILTMLLLHQFAKKLNLHWSLAMFSALTFGFATNAWGYSVTLYAHTISAFFILAGMYSVTFMKGWKGSLLFWLSYALAVYIDFPNLFIFLPMALIEGFRFFKQEENKRFSRITFRWKYFFAPFLFVILMLAYGYYNYIHFGNPTRLSNTIPRVKDLKDIEESVPESGREAVGALNTRNMLEGFSSFIVSTDRGLLIYTPIAFLAIFGINSLTKKKKETEVLLLAVPLTCLILYTMFGDPYGGWAFGSRYVLAVMPELMILAALGLQKYYQNILVKIFYSIVFIYSSAVSLMAPLTTNVIPPLVEARNLGLQASYIININMLKNNELNSFFYNHVLNESISGVTYYSIIAILIGATGLLLIWLPKKYDQKK